MKITLLSRNRLLLILASVIVITALFRLTVINATTPSVERLIAPPPYSIAYFTAVEATPTRLMSANEIEDILGASTVVSMADLRVIDETTDLDAIIIHDSAVSSLDLQWLQARYREGTVIATFNVYGPDVADMLQDHCIARDNFVSEPYDQPFYVVVSWFVDGDDSLDVARALNHAGETCADVPAKEIRERLRFSRGRSTHELTNSDHQNLFATTLVSHLDQIHATTD